MPGAHHTSVCVAMPVKDGAGYLADAIESVLEQADAEFTLHVIDNGSEDESVHVARRYTRDKRVRVDVNEQDIHYYGSLNRVLAQTTAEYFVPFAADDLMYPGNLARKLEAIRETGATFVHSSAEIIDEAGVRHGTGPDHRATPTVLDAPGFFGHLVPCNTVKCQSAVVRTSALREVGGFDGRSFYAGDWLTWLRLSLRARVTTLAQPLVANRLFSGSGTNSSKRLGLNARDLPATIDHIFRDPAMPGEFAALRNHLLAAVHLQTSGELHEVGNRRAKDGWAAYIAMGRALAHAPGDTLALQRYRLLLNEAGLVAPVVPLETVAEPPRDEHEARALLRTVEELGVLLGRVVVGVDPGEIECAFELLEPVFGETEADVALVPVSDPLELIVPGRLALARWGSELVGQVEQRGVPVYPYAIPDPFDTPPDTARWQALDAVACLPSIRRTRSRGLGPSRTLT